MCPVQMLMAVSPEANALEAVLRPIPVSTFPPADAVVAKDSVPGLAAMPIAVLLIVTITGRSAEVSAAWRAVSVMVSVLTETVHGRKSWFAAICAYRLCAMVA